MILLLALYFRLNVVLVTSYLCFVMFDLFFGRYTVHQTSLLKWSRITLLASLLIPLFLETVPNDAIRPIPLPTSPFAIELETVEKMLSSVTETIGANQHTLATMSSVNPYRSFDIDPFFLIIWICIGTASLSRLARLYDQQKRLVRLLDSSARMKQLGKVSVVISQEISVPFSAWVKGKAWVVLPEKILEQWSDAKLAILHELQHHRQNDTVWTVFIEIFICLFLFNPAAYLWRRRISEIQELSCDEILIGRKVSPYEYGCCLVRVAEAALEDRKVFAGTAHMAAGSDNPNYFKSFLRRRIEMLTEYNRASYSLKAGFLGIVSLMATLSTTYATKEMSANKNKDEVNPGVLTTHPQIQAIAESAVTSALKRHSASMGFVVVSDPTTGRVLAVANRDSKNPETGRTLHWALGLRLGPASLAKTIIAAQAVEQGKTTYSEVHDCENGSYELGGRVYHDWQPFHKLSTTNMLVHSGNICAIKVGERLGPKGLAEAFKNFGIGPKGTAEHFPEARTGQVPEPKNADDVAFIGDHANGQGGLYATPIEIVQAFGAIANGGYLLEPQTTSQTPRPKIIRHVLSAKTAEETKQALAQVMVRGTAMKSASKLYRLAGKTGTGYGQLGARIEGKNLIPNLAVFAGFAPVDNPRVVIFVGIENPADQEGKAHGSYHAAPVFKEVAEKTLQYLKIPRLN